MADDTEFWTSRPVLGHIHTHARAVMSCPWAVLGVVLARVVAATPPYVVLPPIIGGHASLNLFIGLVGSSGTGKGAAMAAARDAIRIAAPAPTVNIGSAEGIAHAFARREKGELIRIADAALISIPEIDTLTALAGRSGNSVLAELRKAWTGEDLGFQYADASKRLMVQAHSYRLSLVAGIQPLRAGPVLDDADGGTPQRFVWLPATDISAPEIEPPIPTPRTWTWLYRPPPTIGWETGPVPLVVSLPDVAVTSIREARRATLRGDGDPLDGHRLLCRTKVAAALAALDGRCDVDLDDWDLSTTVMQVSTRTRDRVLEQLADEKARLSYSRAVAEAIGQDITQETLEQRTVDRIKRLIKRHLEQAIWGTLTISEAKQKQANRDRKRFDEVMAEMVKHSEIEKSWLDYPRDSMKCSEEAIRLPGDGTGPMVPPPWTWRKDKGQGRTGPFDSAPV